ncbi:hypothetical protein [Microbispora sp. NBRC 16548]|uniref:hypothetical protein n=1 Tax=Microbispora sp. NBRC 16548 TaxID=3030994 RepID=UPI0024A28A48|nr:hypothetical protein [Microbispora sp. NBRC 16548]GLX03644.1 hypothetical protein Misp03_05710 [Microbispora sp. NBRC 16548]
MPGAPFSVRLRPIAAALLLALLTSTACTSEDSPTAAQAGQTLKKHVLQLLKERNAQNVTITDPGGKNIPCGDGKAKQTFAATGEDIAPRTSPENIRAALLGAVERVATYKVVDAGSLSKPVHVVNDSTRTQLVLDAPGNGIYAVSGETRCLPAA